MSRSKDAVCNKVKYGRKYDRVNRRCKSITFFMFYVNNIKINAVAQILINLNTGTVCSSGCIGVSSKRIFPTTLGKQNCNDQAFVERVSAIKTKNHKISYDRNKEMINARCREIYKEKKKNGKLRYDMNPEKICAQSLVRYHLNKEKISARRRELYNEKKN